MFKFIHKGRIIRVLLLLISILYMWFMYIDICVIQSCISSDKLKFLSMILIFIISLLAKKDALNHKDLHLLQIGLFITVIADLFLLVLNNHYILGISLFSIVQIIYIIRYKCGDIKFIIRKFIVIFISLLIIYFMINKLVIKFDFIWIMGVFYAYCLTSSVVEAFKVYRYKRYPKPNRYMILIGMILFLLCDINVAIYNIFNEGLLYSISSVSMWLFYLPSQVLLSLSGYDYKFL